MIRTLSTLLFILLWGAPVQAGEKTTDSLFTELERALTHRADYSRRKEARIDSLKRLLPSTADGQRLYRLYDQIYREYYTYSFDSAMHYVNLEEATARRLGHKRHIRQSMIHRSILLTTAGYFSESVANLDSVDRSEPFDKALLAEYYYAYKWAYNMWEEYMNDTVYAPRYNVKGTAYLDSLVSLTAPGSTLHSYWMAEQYSSRQRWAEAEAAYLTALRGVKVDERLYAMITYGLACTYLRLNRPEEYEQYLIRAAISDQVCPLKENLALQELALYIFKNDEQEAQRANRYLNYSMEDAVFYNNRLRMLEIARKFPAIIGSYQKRIHAKYVQMQMSLICILLLSAGLVAGILYIRKQMAHIRAHQRELYALNKRLKDSNRSREGYVSLFMDLCAAYINKLAKFQNLVSRKVKAHQTDDLLRLTNASRLNEADAKEFFLNFDRAFLSIYPTFVSEFNALLREGEEIKLRKGEILNTELRIYALIRLGVKDSAKIATLLFYSPQTIYNYRSNVKSRARDKENFEQQVAAICEG